MKIASRGWLEIALEKIYLCFNAMKNINIENAVLNMNSFYD